MDALSTKRLVVKVTWSSRTSTESFCFEDDIGVRPGVLIRPDTLLVNKIGYTLFMSDYYFSALHPV